MRVLIVGCGYVGLRLGEELVRQGHSVWGVRRSHRADPELKNAGIIPLTADLTVPASLDSLDPLYDWVVLCASASGGGARDYEQVYVEGTRHLVSWLRSAPPAKLVFTSSTSVYGQTDGRAVNETSATLPETETGKILAASESVLWEVVRRAGFPATILRVAGIYGPGRAYWLEQFLTGEARIEGEGDRILNMIHREDVVGAIIAALAHGRSGEVYNAVDDEPVTQLTFFRWLSARLSCPMPGTRGREGSELKKRGNGNKSVSNHKLKLELGYRFKLPTFREGYESLINPVGPAG